MQYPLPFVLIACMSWMQQGFSQSYEWVRNTCYDFPVYDVQFDITGTVILSTTKNTCVQLFETSTDEILWSDFNLPENPIGNLYNLTYSSDNLYFAGTGESGVLVLYDNSIFPPELIAGTEVISGTCLSIAFNADNSRIAVGCQGGKVFTYTVPDLVLDTMVIAHLDWVNGLDFSSDGNYIVTSSSDNRVRLWDTSFEPLLLYYSTNDFGAYYSPDNTLIALQGLYNIQIIDAITFEEVSLLDAYHMGVTIYDMAWSPDGSRIVTCHGDSLCYIWDVATATLLNSFGEPAYGIVQSVDWSSDGYHIATGFYTGWLMLWSEGVTQIQPTDAQQFNIYPNPVQDWLFIEHVITDELQISITDITGRVLKSTTTQTSQSAIDVQNLPVGVYVLQLQHPGFYQSQLFIKE